MKVKSILISQPQPKPEASPYQKLQLDNIKVDFRPFIHVEGIDTKELRKQKIDLSQYGAVIMTSRNAVDNYFRLAEEMRYKVPDSNKYFCLNENIALYMQNYIIYRKRKIYAGEKALLDMNNAFQKHKDEKFLLPTSDNLTPDIPKVLESLKINWTRAIMFKTVSSDLSDLSDIKYDILVFFSPLGIKSLFENFPDFKQKETRIAAYGKTTIDAAKKAGLKVNIQVPTDKNPSMSKALEDYIKTKNK